MLINKLHCSYKFFCHYKNNVEGIIMYYRPNLGYNYPARNDEHMIEVKHLRDTNFDENYKKTM